PSRNPDMREPAGAAANGMPPARALNSDGKHLARGYRMWSEVIGVGVVGYGYWGPNLARNFAEAEAAQLVAVCDMDPAKLGLAKRRHPAAVITREFRDLLT